MMSATPASSESGRAPLWLLIVVMVLTVGPMIALCEVLAYWRTDVVDDQMFGYFGWRIAHGATVYLDVWDNKPPGIYWINAVGFLIGNDSYLGVVGMCTLALVVAHAAFFVICASVYHRSVAALATILLSFYVTHGHFSGGTNRTETFLVAFELCAVALYVRGFASDRWWKWFVAGMLCGVAFLFKQVGLAAWGCMGLHTIILVILGELGWRVGLRRCLLLLGGVCATVGAAAVYLASRGALGEAIFATFTFNRQYFSAGVSQFPYNYVTWVLLAEHMRPILLLPILMATAAGIHAVLWWRRPKLRPAEIESQIRAHRPVCPHHFMLFAMWFVVALYGALLSPHGFRHYLVPTIPPLLLMAGYLINVLRAESRLLARLQRRAWVTVAFVIMAYFASDAVRRQFQEVGKVWVFRMDPWFNGVGEYDAAHWEVVGEAVERHTTPDQKVHCFGFMPGVYLHARRISASRFTTTEKVGHVGLGATFVLEELSQTLRRERPAVITLNSVDWKWLQGNARDDRPTDIELGKWIVENYELVEEVPRFGTVYIMKRRDLLEAGTSGAAYVPRRLAGRWGSR